MRAVVQRVARAAVVVAGEPVAAVDEPGLLVLLGVTHEDTPHQAQTLARKIAGLRVLRGERSVLDDAAPVVVVSQFTLYADTRKGRRPSWSPAAPGPVAEPLVEEFAESLAEQGVRVSMGRFGSDMQVELVNDGPVTLILEA